MTKKVKNLKAALKRRDQESDNQMFNETFRNWKKVNDLSDYTGAAELDLLDFVYEVAQKTIGTSHASNVLDDWSEEMIKEFLLDDHVRNKKEINTHDDSYSEDESSFTFDKHDAYPQIKSVFQKKVIHGIESQSFSDLATFRNLFKKLKKLKYKGSEKDLEAMLKNSSDFREFAENEVIRYKG